MTTRTATGTGRPSRRTASAATGSGASEHRVDAPVDAHALLENLAEHRVAPAVGEVRPGAFGLE